MSTIVVTVEETYAIDQAQYEAEQDHMIASPPPLTQWEKGMHTALARKLGSKKLNAALSARDSSE